MTSATSAAAWDTGRGSARPPSASAGGVTTAAIVTAIVDPANAAASSATSTTAATGPSASVVSPALTTSATGAASRDTGRGIAPSPATRTRPFVTAAATSATGAVNPDTGPGIAPSPATRTRRVRERRPRGGSKPDEAAEGGAADADGDANMDASALDNDLDAYKAEGAAVETENVEMDA